jgi:hypothetical protein
MGNNNAYNTTTIAKQIGARDTYRSGGGEAVVDGVVTLLTKEWWKQVKVDGVENSGRTHRLTCLVEDLHEEFDQSRKALPKNLIRPLRYMIANASAFGDLLSRSSVQAGWWDGYAAGRDGVYATMAAQVERGGKTLTRVSDMFMR